ncbi:MAG TPA: IclR family transcriptional regulator [Stellaceae bacterium]|jgi:DNA-binding IclR family transcriptional regulator|nr:IclR family transcriptional regulator [Stellaceae bacterium]
MPDFEASVRQPTRSRVTAIPAEPAEGSSARSSARLVGVFEALARSEEGMSLAELSLALGAPKSSLLGQLRAMVSASYLAHAHGLYRLGPRSFRLAADILAVRRFPNLVRPVLQDLNTRTSETVFLVQLDRVARRATYVDGFDSPNPVRYTVPMGTSRPLYVSAGGLMLLAFQEPAWIDAYLGSVSLDPLTARTITDVGALRQRLQVIRREGFAVSLGETVPGAAGVAAPIFNSDGSVTAGLLIAAPVERFEPQLPEFTRLLRDATAIVSGITQGSPEPLPDAEAPPPRARRRAGARAGRG